MTRENQIKKWLAYAVAVAVVLAVQSLVLRRVVLWGVMPSVELLAVIAVAVLEGALPGGVCGIAVGLLCDSAYFHSNGFMTVLCPLVGMCAGLAGKYALSRGIPGYLVCALGGLVVLDGVRLVVLWATAGAGLVSLLPLAGREIGVTLIFALPVYGWFRLFFRRVGEDRLERN